MSIKPLHNNYNVQNYEYKIKICDSQGDIYEETKQSFNTIVKNYTIHIINNTLDYSYTNKNSIANTYKTKVFTRLREIFTKVVLIAKIKRIRLQAIIKVQSLVKSKKIINN